MRTHATRAIIFLAALCYATSNAQAEKLSPDQNCYNLIKQARNYIHAGEAEEAIVILKKAIALNPRSSEAHCKMADCLCMQHQFQASLLECSKSISLDPRSAGPYYRQAVDLGALKDFPASLKSFDKAIGLKPENANFYLGRAELYRVMKKPEKAIADLHTYLAIAPANDQQIPTIHLTAAEYYRGQGNLIGERKELTELIDIDIDSSDGYRLRGDSWYAEQNYARAEADYKKALKIEPENEHCLKMLKEIRAHTIQKSLKD